MDEARLLALLEAETAGLDEGDDDTSGIDDPDGMLTDPDTAGYDDDDDTGDVEEYQAMMRVAESADVGRLTRPAFARALQRARKSGRKVRRATAKKRRVVPMVPAPKLVVAKRRMMVNDWKNAWPGQRVIVQPAFLYTSMFFEFTGVGTATQGMLVLKAGATAQGFTKYIDDTTTFLGHTITYTENETNLAKLAANTYPRQRFLIEKGVFAQKAMFVQYNAATVNATAFGADVKDTLLGKKPIFDEDGAFLPVGFFHDYSGRNELYRALASCAVLKFSIERQKVGGNKSADEFVIDTMTNIPAVGRDAPFILSTTSGGASLPYMNKSIVWNLDRNDPKAMTFAANVELRRDFAFGFKPVKATANMTEDHPEKVGLVVELRLMGMSARPAADVEAELK